MGFIWLQKVQTRERDGSWNRSGVDGTCDFAIVADEGVAVDSYVVVRGDLE